MVVLTREQRKQDFNHVMSILEVEPEENALKLFMALTQNGKRSIITISNEDRKTLKDLKATDADNNTLALDDWEVSEIINISRYTACLREEKGEDFRLKDIDASLFEDFKLSPTRTKFQCAQGDITRTPPSSLTSSHSPNLQHNRSHAPAESFKKGVKRDSTMHNTFKDGKQWDTWRRHLRATAMAQDVDDVLNKDYAPTTPEDADLFQEKKKFMYSVFERTLLTDQGKALVRQHESAYDSQITHKHLSACYEENVKAALDSSSLLAYITTARIDEWKGSSESVMLNWQEKVRQYELLVKPEDKFSPVIKLTMLQNAVSPVEHLKQVKDTAQQLKVSLGQDLQYDGYEKLLKETAITHDSKLRVQPSRAARRAYEHDAAYYDEPPDPGEELHIDSSIETTLANKTITKFKPTNPDSLMPKEAYLKLPPAARSTWNRLDAGSKPSSYQHINVKLINHLNLRTRTTKVQIGSL